MDLELSSALEATVDRFAGMVRRIGLQYRLSEADLDEVLQGVRIRLWRARGSSEQIAAVSTSYVYRTASTAALDVLRRRRTRREALSDELDGPVAAGLAAAGGPDRELEGSELAAEVSRAIETIPASRRPVVRMYLAGYPREEIADLMGWTEAKTRNLLYRGLADLRERLVARGIGVDLSEELSP